jgi:hypothetical protein
MTVYSRFEAKVLQLLREVSNEFGVAFNLITIDICQGWASLAENQYANIINLCIGAIIFWGLCSCVRVSVSVYEKKGVCFWY